MGKPRTIQAEAKVFMLPIPKELKAKLRAVAKLHGVSMTTVILAGTKEKVEQLEQQKPVL